MLASPLIEARPSKETDRQVAYIPDVLSPHAGLALHKALADELTSQSNAFKLIVWRCTPALLVTTSETRLPCFDESAAQMQSAGWPVVVRKSGGAACPVGPGTVQIATIEAAREGTTMSIKYDALAKLIISMLASFQVDSQIAPVAGAYCPGRHDLSIRGRKIAGISQRWFRNRYGVRCAIASASLNVEEPPEKLASAVNDFFARAGSAFRCQATALTNMRLSDCRAVDLMKAVISRLVDGTDILGVVDR
jgi:octanoyl-[GcvH]:protein N-octanoyltransferase